MPTATDGPAWSEYGYGLPIGSTPRAASATEFRRPGDAAPRRWACGSRATATGWYRGSPIGRMPLVKLFASVLRREADGSYWLVTPVERGRIEVEDAPFVAVELAADRAGGRGSSCGCAPISTSG